MKVGDVLKITGISRRHLSNLVKQGKFRVTVKPSGQYDYNADDIYQYISKVRQNLNVIYAWVSTPKHYFLIKNIPNFLARIFHELH